MSTDNSLKMGRIRAAQSHNDGILRRWPHMIAPKSNNNEAMDGVALFCAGLTLETYVTGAPNPVKCSASYGRGNSMTSETPLSDVRFLTVAEVALIMRVSKMTVYRLVHSGELEAIRVGRSFRVPEQAVNHYRRAAFAGTGGADQPPGACPPRRAH